MVQKIQYLSVQFLNSHYKILLTFLFYVFVCYSCSGKLLLCMNESDIPSMVEAKPIISRISPASTKSVMQREINEFIGFAETIEEQNRIIFRQQHSIKQLEDLYQASVKAHTNDIEIVRKNELTARIYAEEEYKKTISDLKKQVSELKYTRREMRNQIDMLERIVRNVSEDYTAYMNEYKK